MLGQSSLPPASVVGGPNCPPTANSSLPDEIAVSSPDWIADESPLVVSPPTAAVYHYLLAVLLAMVCSSMTIAYRLSTMMWCITLSTQAHPLPPSLGCRREKTYDGKSGVQTAGRRRHYAYAGAYVAVIQPSTHEKEGGWQLAAMWSFPPPRPGD